MALTRDRHKTLTLEGYDIEYLCINAQCTFSLGDGVRVDLGLFVKQNPHIPMKLNLKCFAAGFLTVSRTVEQQRRYIATKIDRFNVTPENSRWLERSNSNATVLLFARGTIVVTGAKDGASAKLAAHQMCNMMNRAGGTQVYMSDFLTCNQVVRFDIPFCIDLPALKGDDAISNRIHYTPERFPLATLHSRKGEQPPCVPPAQPEDDQEPPPTSRRAALISKEGHIIVTGAQSLADAVRFMRRVFPYLLRHMDRGRTEEQHALAHLGIRPTRGKRPNALNSGDIVEVMAHVVGRTSYAPGDADVADGSLIPLGKRARPLPPPPPTQPFPKDRALQIVERGFENSTTSDEWRLLVALHSAIEARWDLAPGSPPRKMARTATAIAPAALP